VTGVFVRGTNWTSSFLDALESDGLGDATLGFEIETGSSDQARRLPWSNIDRISIVYSEDVAIDASDVRLAGVNVTDYGFTFSYDASSATATLDLDAPLGVDTVLIDVEDPSASGDGVAGGDFQRLFTAVPGDVDRNGGVNVLDLIQVRNRVGNSTANPGNYSVFSDLDGNGGHNVLDLINVRNRVGASQPSDRPEAEAASPALLAAVSASEVSEGPVASVMADEDVVARAGAGAALGWVGIAWSSPTLARHHDGDLLAIPRVRTVVVETDRSLGEKSDETHHGLNGVPTMPQVLG